MGNVRWLPNYNAYGNMATSWRTNSHLMRYAIFGGGKPWGLDLWVKKYQ